MATWQLWAQVGLMGVFGSLGHCLMIQAHHRTPDGWTVLGVALKALCGGLGVRVR